MGESKTFEFAIDQLEQAGRDLLEFAQKNPVVFSLSVITIAAGVATIVVPIAVGFGPLGPIAGMHIHTFSCRFAFVFVFSL